jgi:acetylornithine aminotransferase
MAWRTLFILSEMTVESFMNTLNCNYKTLNPNIVTGNNCYVIDDTGKKYIDFEAGVWCLSLGHSNKQINDVIINQLNSICHVGYRYTSKIVDEAAEKVLSVLGFADGKCVFLSSGSEAVEFGVQLAKKIMDRPYFLCLNNFFLSSYGISATRSEEQWISLDLSEYSGDPDSFLKNIPFSKIGAFVFEPGNASGAVRLPPVELIKAIERIIKETGGIVVVDEVTTGIGRTGKWFGFEHYNMHPDIVSLGKGIGNGYPVSVIAMSKPIAERAEASDFRYAQSHQDNPLGCAVVKEVISVIDEGNYIQRSAQMGSILEHALKSLQTKHKRIKEVRGVGLMYAMEFCTDNELPLERVHQELFDMGYITGLPSSPSANLLRFYPPLTIEEVHIKGLVDALNIVLLTVHK